MKHFDQWHEASSIKPVVSPRKASAWFVILLALGCGVEDSSSDSSDIDEVEESSDEVVNSAITNPGFEASSPCSGWSGCSTVTSQKHAGQRAAKRTIPSSGSDGIYQHIAVQPGLTYRASGWQKTASGATGPGCYVRIAFLNQAGSIIHEKRSTRGLPTSWTRRTVSAVAPQGAVKGRVTGRCDAGSGTVYWDDFEFGPQVSAGETRTLWDPFELTFVASGTPTWSNFPLTVTFAHSSGEKIKMEGFWDGGKTWKVRFAATKTGQWTWSSSSSESGLGGKSGAFSVANPSSDQVSANPNLRGHLRIASNKRTFHRADGTAFFYLGDTGWNFGSVPRASVTKWADDRKNRGFTVAQIRYATPELDNEEGYPFSSSGGASDNGNYSQINPSHFQELDVRMRYLFAKGFAIAGHPDWITEAPYDLTEAKNYSRYLMARYGAYPLVWSVTGEYHLATAYWSANNYGRVSELATFLQTKNAYEHPMSVHPGGVTSSGEHFHSKAWLDHNWIQTYKSPQKIPLLISEALAASPAKPVILSEGQYEAIPNLDAPADLQRRQAWVALLSGASGFVYGAYPIYGFQDISKLSLPGAKDMSRVRSFFDANDIHLSDLNPKVASGGCVRVNGSNPSLTNTTHARCAGTSGAKYVLYAPVGSSGHTLEMRGLANKSYVATWYNPATGTSTKVNGGNPINTDLNDTWAVPARPSSSDWVLWLKKP